MNWSAVSGTRPVRRQDSRIQLSASPLYASADRLCTHHTAWISTFVQTVLPTARSGPLAESWSDHSIPLVMGKFS